MTTLQASNLLISSSLSTCKCNVIESTLHAPKLKSLRLSFPKLSSTNLVEELNIRNGYKTTTTTEQEMIKTSTSGRDDEGSSNSLVMAELYAILETISDRIEMHANIGEQRNNWNTLLLTSINTITITAATMAGLASISGNGTPLLALKLSSTLLYSAATGLLVVMNKIQPSQLAEEQRNAVRLFKQLQRQIHTTIALRSPTSMDVNGAIKKVLALDKAFPLPLLGGVMLEKFPKTVQPAVWWPQQGRQGKQFGGELNNNGWNASLLDEMREIVGVLERKDTQEYVRLSKMILKVNKTLAIVGPLLTGMAALGSTLVGSPSHGSWAAVLAIVGGAMASVINTVEHGGQVGMVFEMYRSCAGSFQLLKESIESTLNEKEVERRENGEVFEMKVALQLGRSLSELRSLAGCSSIKAEDVTEEFASKLL
ncbi:F-box protein [Thalictrum thalictroides]|uniref:F-box protein n=1 Tax=Thalictrum thalictroides TaxID=46969 RepID=A0A7J6UWF8_THATH|nr:F-box protein [Thalictrum thalictroides]